MTIREKLAEVEGKREVIRHAVNQTCPHKLVHFAHIPIPKYCGEFGSACTHCWNREYVEPKE